METGIMISENGWEYAGNIIVTSKEFPVIKEDEHGDMTILLVDGVTLRFDEEIELE